MTGYINLSGTPGLIVIQLSSMSSYSYFKNRPINPYGHKTVECELCTDTKKGAVVIVIAC